MLVRSKPPFGKAAKVVSAARAGRCVSSLGITGKYWDKRAALVGFVDWSTQRNYKFSSGIEPAQAFQFPAKGRSSQPGYLYHYINA